MKATHPAGACYGVDRDDEAPLTPTRCPSCGAPTRVCADQSAVGKCITSKTDSGRIGEMLAPVTVHRDAWTAEQRAAWEEKQRRLLAEAAERSETLREKLDLLAKAPEGHPLHGLTPDEAAVLCERVYVAAGWGPSGDLDDDDHPSSTMEMLRLLLAPTDEAACSAVRWWSCWESEEEMLREVKAARALGGVAGGTLEEQLRATGLPVCIEAAEIIEEQSRLISAAAAAGDQHLAALQRTVDSLQRTDAMLDELIRRAKL